MYVHFFCLLVKKLNLLHMDDFRMYFSFTCLNSGMIAYDYVDIKYAHCGLDFYPGDANHTVGSFANLLQDLESLLTSSSCALFVGCGITPIYKALLEGKEVCLSLL